MDQLKVSVCIPVYNGEKFIAQAIDSVLCQTMTAFELLVIDNHSEDRTIAIVRQYDDPRIKLIQNERNIGMIANWNKAIDCASAKYMKILAADDLIYPDCLRRQCDVLDLDAENNISLVATRRHIINEGGKVLFSRGFTFTEGPVSGIKAINKNVRSGGNIIGESAAVMFRKEVIAKTGGFSSDIFYVFDIDLWFRILLQGKLYVIPEELSAFRVSGSSASVGVAKKQLKDVLNFNDKIYSKPDYKLSWFSFQIGYYKALLHISLKRVLYKFMDAL